MSDPAFTAKVVRWRALLGIGVTGAVLAYLFLTPGYGVHVGIGGLPGVTATVLDEIGVPGVRPVIGVLGDVALGLGVFAFTWRFFAGGVRVRVDEAGILARDYFDAPIPWDEIERAWIEDGEPNATRSLHLQLRDVGRRRAKFPMGLVWPFGGQRRRREINVSMADLDGDFDAMIDAVERFRPSLLRR